MGGNMLCHSRAGGNPEYFVRRFIAGFLSLHYFMLEFCEFVNRYKTYEIRTTKSTPYGTSPDGISGQLELPWTVLKKRPSEDKHFSPEGSNNKTSNDLIPADVLYLPSYIVSHVPYTTY